MHDIQKYYPVLSLPSLTVCSHVFAFVHSAFYLLPSGTQVSEVNVLVAVSAP